MKLAEDLLEEAKEFFTMAKDTWLQIDEKRLRKFGLHFDVNLILVDIIQDGEPVEKTDNFKTCADLYFEINRKLWYYDYWSMILGSIYSIYYYVRLWKVTFKTFKLYPFDIKQELNMSQKEN